MQTEIERKFLTTNSLFKEQAVRVMDIRQGYIGITDKGEARVSIRDEKAWIIVKSNERLSRLEYEIPIPKKDAEELLTRTCGRIIHKTRYVIPATSGMLKWEVDEFHEEDEGLIIAEIELPSEDTQFDKPQWLGKEVTQDTTYYNSTLSRTSWKAIQKSYAEAKAWDDWRDFISKEMKYRKKPVIIEAIQFEDNTDCILAIHEFMGQETTRVNYEDKDNPYIKIETLEGTMKASVGDYIIKGVNGEFYPCKPDIFEKTYEEVTE